MNKILITATLMAMFALTSCMKNEAVSDAGLAKGLSFGSYSDLPTKADSTFVGTGVTKIPVNGTFGVYSFLTGSRITSVDGLNPSFFSNLKVTFDGKKYTYSPTKYWPADTVRNKLSFFAYYPCDNLSILSKPTSEGNGGMGRYNYQVADKAQNQVDFMVSDLVPNLTYEHTNTGVTGLVNLKFHHLLSQVLVKAKVDAEDANTVVRISSIKFNNILSKGTMTPSYKDGKTSFEWSDLAEPKSYEVPLAKPFAALGTKAKDITSGDGAVLILMPQPLVSSLNPTITVTYTMQTGADQAIENTITVPIYEEDYTAAVKTWSINQRITYTFIVGMSSFVIKFSSSVSEWDPNEDKSLM